MEIDYFIKKLIIFFFVGVYIILQLSDGIFCGFDSMTANCLRTFG